MHFGFLGTFELLKPQPQPLPQVSRETSRAECHVPNTRGVCALRILRFCRAPLSEGSPWLRLGRRELSPAIASALGRSLLYPAGHSEVAQPGTQCVYPQRCCTRPWRGGPVPSVALRAPSGASVCVSVLPSMASVTSSSASLKHRTETD